MYIRFILYITIKHPLCDQKKVMTRKKIKSALSASLKAEDQAVKDRFERAETILKESESLSNQANSDTPTSSDNSAKSTPKKRVIRDSFTLPESDYELIKTLITKIIVPKGRWICVFF